MKAWFNLTQNFVLKRMRRTNIFPRKTVIIKKTIDMCSQGRHWIVKIGKTNCL